MHKFAFTVATPVSLSLPNIGKLDNKTLHTFDKPCALVSSKNHDQQLQDFVKELQKLQELPPDSTEIIIYKLDSAKWQQCGRLLRGWVFAKLSKNEQTSNTMLVRHSVHPVHEVLDHVIFPNANSGLKKRRSKKSNLREYDGIMVKMDSLRYQTFALKGVVCVSCGLVGQYFALERHKTKSREVRESVSQGYHFNLYGLAPDQKEILFTKDHIHPKSKGGPDKLSNLDPMCSICNGQKADTIIAEVT